MHLGCISGVNLTAWLEAANLPSCRSCRAARTARRHILPGPGCRCGTLLALPPLQELHGVTHVTQMQEATSSSLQRDRPDQYTRHHDRERRAERGRQRLGPISAQVQQCPARRAAHGVRDESVRRSNLSVPRGYSPISLTQVMSRSHIMCCSDRAATVRQARLLAKLKCITTARAPSCSGRHACHRGIQ